MSRFLRNAISGREPLLMEPTRAIEHAKQAEKVGFTDALEMLFGKAPEAYVDGGVGVIPLQGVIGKGLTRFERMTGGQDLDVFAEQLAAFEADPSVHTILIKVSSPGGTVTGVEEVATQVARASKPTVTFTDSEMASAAMWIGAQAQRVLVTPSSSVGSVGVYSVYYDFREALEREGITAKVFSAGKYKGMGIYGTSLTPEQEEFLQASVLETWADFKAAVKSRRTLVRDEDMEAQVFSGRVAAQKGLATGVVNSFAEVMASLRR